MNAGTDSVLLLVGSPKAPGKSVSETLGTYALEQIKQRGWNGETMLIRTSLQSDQRKNDLLRAVEDSDLVILSFPLYVDSLPAHVIRAMELIAKRRAKRGARFAVIANCGFPEAEHNNMAISICKRFADASGMDWAGGLALGMGGALSGRRLQDQGPIVGNIIKSLDLAVNALVKGGSIPDKAVHLMAKPVIPGWMYTTVGNLSWHKQARRYGVRDRLRDRPYHP